MAAVMKVLRPNPTLDKLSRFLNSVRGTDKVLMLVQYASKILIWHLRRNPEKASTLVQRILNLVGPISDFRILLRYYGLIPLTQWALYSEANPAPTAKLQLLTRLQNLCNFCYYPLEHAYWLGLHQVVKMKPETRDRIGIWSCRFWAAYVVLYFGQLWEERKLLRKRERELRERKVKVGGDVKEVDVGGLVADVQKLNEEKNMLAINALINAAYFPLTIHWSLESSSFPDVGVGICGTIAAVAQFYTAWKSA
ncbi:peroxisomal biogenesis factor 11 [Fimicolochytrium jonesii]|uniref:peroxisomal biogenesis factor 11 n=1 Tax=Fimicolochytrium jonesii TaxID=1396493 RepID=UPI0022FE0DEC|nr:peroxisomal biogenesis factor 11 [Fimicolochytrium jonesii]KAI8817611.1 peroxisomal biogenesis factor 11 [Fimicolochytrium jonesii]